MEQHRRGLRSGEKKIKNVDFSHCAATCTYLYNIHIVLFFHFVDHCEALCWLTKSLCRSMVPHREMIFYENKKVLENMLVIKRCKYVFVSMLLEHHKSCSIQNKMNVEILYWLQRLLHVHGRRGTLYLLFFKTYF